MLVFSAHPASLQLRRDHLGIVDDKLVTGAQQIRQIAHRIILEAIAGPYHQKARAFARFDRAQSNIFGWKVEIEQIGTHDGPVMTGLFRPGNAYVEAAKTIMPGARPGMRHAKRWSSPLRGVGCHVRLDDLVGVINWLAALDLVAVLHAGSNLAPNGVLLVEEARIVEADEELAVAGIRVGGARHRHRAAHMRLGVEFGLQFLAGAAGAAAVRATGLRHEAVDHAMKHDAVVEALTHQFLDARDMARREVRTHFDDYFALRGVEDEGDDVVSHDISLHIEIVRCVPFETAII